MSNIALANAFRRIAKKASHPNALLYKTQLGWATQKYVVRGELGDGKEDTVLLAAPENDGRKEGREEAGVGAESGVAMRDDGDANHAMKEAGVKYEQDQVDRATVSDGRGESELKS